MAKERKYGMVPRALTHGDGAVVVNAQGAGLRQKTYAEALGLGGAIENGMTVDQVLAATGTDWEVEKVALQTVTGRPIPDAFAVAKRGTGEVVSGCRAVSKGYQEYQNRERAEFAEVLVEAAGGELRFEAGGAMGYGQIVWYQARVPKDAVIRETPKGADKVEPFLFLIGAHDGTMSETICFTSHRPWCNNQINHLLSSAATRYTVRHTRNMHERLAEARKALKVVLGGFDEHVAEMKALDAQAMSLAEMKAFAEKLIGETQQSIAEADRTIGKAVQERRIAQQDRLVDLFRHGKGNIGRTRFDALNAATEFADHHKEIRTVDSRIRRLVMAPAADDFKVRAHRLLA